MCKFEHNHPTICFVAMVDQVTKLNLNKHVIDKHTSALRDLISTISSAYLSDRTLCSLI